MYIQYYFNQLGNIPEFLNKYLNVPSLVRLKNVGYFCGMDYASKDIYNFREYISRYDHSLSVALITYKLTRDKIQTIAALFHDIATPCFSHVIDYMNKDYEKQESTEEYTGKTLMNDKIFMQYLKEDNINIEDIINFKDYTIVDNNRPKVCADRIDGIILTGIGWTKNIEKEDIKNIVEDMCIMKNEYNEEEIGFKTLEVVQKIIDVSKSIDLYCHSKEDNYMMELLAKITKFAIENRIISYEDLYLYNENKLFDLFEKEENDEFKKYINEFKNIKKENIEKIDLPNIKARDLNPLLNGIRMN